MYRRTDDEGPGGAGSIAGGAVEPSGGRPDLAGDFDSLLSSAPWFRTRVPGYDRLQVDNYVAWAEAELATGRRQIEHLLARYGACSAELEISRRLLAEAPKGVVPSPVSERMRHVLRLAADEATAMIDAAREEADQIVAEARLEADARLRKAHQIKEVAAETADGMVEQAGQQRAEAAALLERACSEAAEVVRAASSERDRLAGERDQLTGERDRLTAEAADARTRLAAVQAEVDDLQRQRDDARSSLRRLTDLIGEALAVVTGSPPDQYLLLDNHVAEHPPADDRMDDAGARVGSLSS